jgi:hypothetical protein
MKDEFQNQGSRNSDLIKRTVLHPFKPRLMLWVQNSVLYPIWLNSFDYSKEVI